MADIPHDDDDEVGENSLPPKGRQGQPFFPRAKSLRFMVTMTILIPIVIVLAISTAVEYTRHRQRDLDSMTVLASQTGQVIEQVLRREMMESDFVAIQSIFDAVGKEPYIERLLLLAPDGRVIFSPQKDENGALLDNRDVNCQPCHRLAPADRPKGVIVSNASGDDIFRSMQPIKNEPACTRCHDAGQPLIGLLLADLSITPVQSALATDLRENILWWVGTGLTMIILANIAINRTVLLRIQRMAHAIEGVSEGRTPEMLPTEPQDEIGRLSAVFNDMAARVRSRETENARLSAALRSRIQERGELLRQLIRSQEDERIRLARELHDDLGQMLSGINFQLELAHRAMHSNPENAKPYLNEALRLLSETTDRMYEVILGLRPSILDDLGLVPALKSLAQRSFAPAGIRYQIRMDTIEDALSPDQETALFRIFQEAISNVLRHADAQNVTLELRSQEGALVGLIEDDGRGIEAPARSVRPDGSGFGLLGMRERAELCGGSLIIEPGAPRGTRIRIEIPVEGDHVPG